jgi:PhnB protein
MEVVMPVQPVPEGFHTVTPYLTVTDAAGLLDYLTRAFDARPVHVMKGPDGAVGHADVIIGTSHVMLGQARDAAQARASMLYLYVPDCDAAYQKAIAAGGTSITEPATQFYGDRHGAVKDAFGNQWWIATHVEDVAPEELERRAKAARPA